MSKDENTSTTETTTENVEQSTPAQSTSDNMVPSYRLKEESDKRRTAERQLADIQKKEQDVKDADLGYKERLEKVTSEFDSFKQVTSQKNLAVEFTSKAIEVGFSPKIAKLGVPTDLSEDNMDNRLKEFTKDMKEFLPDKETKTETKSNTFATMQPKQPAPITGGWSNTKSIKGGDVVKELINK